MLLFIIIIVITVVVVVCRRRRSKSFISSMELNEDERTDRTIPAAETDNNANDYCSIGPTAPEENKDYSTAGQREPTNTTSVQNDYQY